MNTVANYVAANLDKKLTVDHLAEIAHLSKFHFQRIHHALTGETIHGMVSRLRLEAAAATLIYQKNLTVTRVAFDLGYSSGANFTKAFTKHFGCSPSTYRTKRKVREAKTHHVLEDSNVNLEVKIQHMPETHLAYTRRKGKYIHGEIAAMHRKVHEWVRDRACIANMPANIGITWSDSLVASEEDWVYDACVAVQPNTKGCAEVDIQTLQSGNVAQFEVELSEGESHDLSRYWDWFIRDWFMASQFELRSSPSYEMYVNSERGFKDKLCLPICSEAIGAR